MKENRLRTLRSKQYIFRRYVWLMTLIYDYKQITFEEISDKWAHSSLNEDETPFPKRTFFDHINAIEDFFNITIECKNNYQL